MGHIKDRWHTGKGDEKKPTTRYGKGLRWQVWYRVDGRDKCGGSFAKKSDAEKKLVELESSVLRGAWVDPTDQTRVVDYARRYFATRPHRERTAQRMAALVTNHIEGTALDTRMASVKPSDAQAWVSDRAKVLAPSSLALVVKLVRGVFVAAVLDRLIPRSPFVKITMPRAERERVTPLTVAQVIALRDEMRPKYRAMVTAQAGLGLRIGELLALRVEDVNFLGRSVRIEHQIDKVTRERVAPKTPKSRRTVPLPDVVSVALAEHIRQHPPAKSGLLFHTAGGMPYWHEYYTSKVFKPAVERAQLPSGTTTHDLRHHFASVLLQAGESVVAVAERLGHEDGTLVLTTYGHLMPDSEDRTRKAVDGAWNAAFGSSGEAATAPARPGGSS